MVRNNEDLIFIDVNPEKTPRKNDCRFQLDDSGFVKDLEEAGIGENVNYASTRDTELDDKSFFSNIQPKLENDVETKTFSQSKRSNKPKAGLTSNADRCRRFVNLFSCKKTNFYYFSDPVKRRRRKPKKMN